MIRGHYIKRAQGEDLILDSIKKSPKKYEQIKEETGIPRTSLAGLLNGLERKGKIKRLGKDNIEERTRFGIKDTDGRKVFYVKAEDSAYYAIQTEMINKISDFLEILGNTKRPSLNSRQVQIYIDELAEGLSKELQETLDIGDLFKLYRIAEDGSELIKDETKRTGLLFRSLEALIGKTSKKKFESVEFRNYVTEKISAHLETLKNKTDAQELSSVTEIISRLLIILGNIGYEFLENVVCFILQIDEKDSGGSVVQNVLKIKREERNQIDPDQIFWIIQKSSHYGSDQFSPYLNQLIKGNVDRMFRKEVAAVNSNPKLAEMLKKIRDMAKYIPLK